MTKFWREAVIVLLLGGLGYIWLESHDAKIRGEEGQKALVEIKKVEAQKVAEIEELRKSIRDPEVIVKEVPKYLPFAVTANGPAMKPGEPPQPPQITIQGQELPRFWDYVQECRECSVKLEARDAEVKNLEGQLKAEKKKSGLWGKVKWAAIGAVGGVIYGMTR